MEFSLKAFSATTSALLTGRNMGPDRIAPASSYASSDSLTQVGTGTVSPHRRPQPSSRPRMARSRIARRREPVRFEMTPVFLHDCLENGGWTLARYQGKPVRPARVNG
jgi:hypothetical protein